MGTGTGQWRTGCVGKGWARRAALLGAALHPRLTLEVPGRRWHQGRPRAQSGAGRWWRGRGTWSAGVARGLHATPHSPCCAPGCQGRCQHHRPGCLTRRTSPLLQATTLREHQQRPQTPQPSTTTWLTPSRLQPPGRWQVAAAAPPLPTRRRRGQNTAPPWDCHCRRAPRRCCTCTCTCPRQRGWPHRPRCNLDPRSIQHHCQQPHHNCLRVRGQEVPLLHWRPHH